ncbi:hypothetical protein VZT92_003784 [Zoarces viviparus]|uniref:Uncharacterized protein n=1 Tax=Zoarces viviparus TaxID=48416 RepID=A0AAW1FUI8_ZOAVI
MRTLLLASALLAGLFVSLAAVPVPDTAPGPYRAFCKTMWLFATPCAEISTKLVQQIQAWSPQYTLLLGLPTYIKANHTSLSSPEGENIILILNPTVLSAGCRVTAMSFSLAFTSLLDGGLNYCNLNNLVSASGLTSAPGFMEMTNEWACLSYGLATCKA